MGLPWFLPWGYHCSTARSCPPLEQNFTERDVTKVVRPMRSVSCATQDTNINKTFRPTVIPPTQLVTKKFGWRAGAHPSGRRHDRRYTSPNPFVLGPPVLIKEPRCTHGRAGTTHKSALPT